MKNAEAISRALAALAAAPPNGTPAEFLALIGALGFAVIPKGDAEHLERVRRKTGGVHPNAPGKRQVNSEEPGDVLPRRGSRDRDGFDFDGGAGGKTTMKLPKAIYLVWVGSKDGRKTILTGEGETFVFTKDGCLIVTVIAETAEEAGEKAKRFSTNLGPEKPANAPTSAMYHFVTPQRYENLVVLSVEWLRNLDVE